MLVPLAPPAPLLLPQARQQLTGMGPQVPWVTSALWALGSLALLLGLWTLCTACHRYVHSCGAGTWYGQGASSSCNLLCWAQCRYLHPISAMTTLLPPRKQAPRQQAGLQGMEAQVEEVAAWLSLGPGWGHQGTNGLPCPQPLLKRPHIHSLSKSETRLHDLPLGPRSSRGEGMRMRKDWWWAGPAAPHCSHPSDLCQNHPSSLQAGQHRSAHTLEGGLQKHHQATGSLLTWGAAPGQAGCRPDALQWP